MTGSSGALQTSFSAVVSQPRRNEKFKNGERKLFYLLTLALMGDPFKKLRAS